jgi:hypothetical protein
MSTNVLHGLVWQAQENYYQIRHREWKRDKQASMSETDMWREARQIGPKD